MSSPFARFNTYGIAARPPVHRVDAEATPLYPHMFPDMTEVPDTSFDRVAVVNEGIIDEEIPEIRPIFLGMRKALHERKLAKLSGEINTAAEEAAEDSEVIVDVAQQIIRGKGYMDPENPLRPVKRRHVSAAKKLENITTKRRKHQIEDSHVVRSHPEINDHGHEHLDEENLTPPSGVSERWNVRGAKKFHHHTEHKHHKLDRKFANIVAGKKLPRVLIGRGLIDRLGGGATSDQIEEKTAKREDLAKKIHGIEIAQAKQEVKKARRQAFRSEVAKAWRGRTDAALGHREEFYEDLARAADSAVTGEAEKMDVKPFEFRTEGGTIERLARKRVARHKTMMDRSGEDNDGQAAIKRKKILERRATKYSVHKSTTRRRQANARKLATRRTKTDQHYRDLRDAKQRLNDLQQPSDS